MLFAYGAFTTADASAVAGLLTIYALAIPLWGIHQIVSRHFYAQGRMWLPVVIGTAALVPTIPMWMVGRANWGERGMATASTLSMLLYAGALLGAWWKESGTGIAGSLFPTLVRSAAAATAGALAGRAVTASVFAAGDSVPVGILAVLIGGATAAVAFILTAVVVRAPELRDVTRRRRPVSDSPALPPEGSDPG